jgi:tRNA threonylcarbamoyladenosine biosynthesis protein TsaB
MGTWFGVGTGWRVYADVLTARLGRRLETFDAECYPAARHVALLGLDAFKQGRTISAEQVLPVYLRDQVVRGG